MGGVTRMRLIDAEKLMKRICGHECGMYPEDCDGMESETVPCNFYAYVSEMPTVDAVPVKRGKWSEYSRNALETYIECTNCCVASRPIHLQMVTKDGSGLPDFCPNCGADMREEAHNVD